MLPLPTVRMSTPRVARTTQYPNGRLPARYPATMKRTVSIVGYFTGIWYPVTQSLTVAQSRFSKKASM